MVQSNLDGRSRVRRTRQSEEQAPLVESYLSGNSSTIYHGTHSHIAKKPPKKTPKNSNNHSVTETLRVTFTLKGRRWFQSVITLTCQYRPKLLKQRVPQRPVIENGNACLLIVRQTMLPFFALPAVLAWVTLLISVPDCSVLDKPFLQCHCNPQSSILKHLLVSGVFPLSYEKPFLCFVQLVSKHYS